MFFFKRRKSRMFIEEKNAGHGDVHAEPWPDEGGGAHGLQNLINFRIFSNEVQRYLAGAAGRAPGAGGAAVADEAHSGPT